mmetsp:Transcript_45683/g.145863  ORF Transcript_45683/g.145863 Transcript_45683/m.145863 type:complete len:231 (+) Transcript_45683:598-1290(+)
MNSSTCCCSSSNLKVLTLAVNSFRMSSNSFCPCSSKTSGSMGLFSGASWFSLCLKATRSRSLCLKISTLTKASRSCTALPLLSAKASTKFLRTFSKDPGLISTPRGAEGFGKSCDWKKRLVNSSNSWKKSLPISLNSPLKLASITARPGWGRPKQAMESKTSLSRSDVSLRPCTLELKKLSKCCLLICLHSSKPQPFSYQAQSRTTNSRWPKGAPSLERPAQAACAKVVK